MPSFDVESYRVSVSARSSDSASPSLFLVSPDMSHGIRNRVTIHFETSIPSGIRDNDSIGYVLNVGGLNFNGLTMHAYMSPSIFDEVYGIVRDESPIKVVFSYKSLPDSPSSTTKLLTYIKVGTEDEIPGEGAPDDDAEVMEAMVLDLVSANGVV